MRRHDQLRWGYQSILAHLHPVPEMLRIADAEPPNYLVILDYSLIEPASIPRIKRFWETKNMIMIGSAIKIPASAISGL